MTTSDTLVEMKTGHKARNRELAKKFISSGVSLAEPRSIDLHFWADDESSARQLADALVKMGCASVSVASSHNKAASWSLEAHTNRSVDAIIEDSYVASLVDLACSVGARFDGWGTSIYS